MPRFLTHCALPPRSGHESLSLSRLRHTSMSSSRRSSRSSRSNPSWRSVSVSQSSAPTISLVFGQPEQGAPLAAAISKFPAPKLCETASLNDSMMGNSIHNETKDKREGEEMSEQPKQGACRCP